VKDSVLALGVSSAYAYSIINDKTPAIDELDGLQVLKIAWAFKEAVKKGIPVKIRDKKDYH